MNKDKNKEMLIPYAPTGIDEKIYITKRGQDAIKKASLGDAIINLDKIITEGFSKRELELYEENTYYRLKLADLEDDVMGRYPNDWFKCELCSTVQHRDNVASTNLNDPSKFACENCRPNFEEE